METLKTFIAFFLIGVEGLVILFLWDWINDNHEEVFGDNSFSTVLASKKSVSKNSNRLDELEEELQALCRHFDLKIVKDREVVSGHTHTPHGSSPFRQTRTVYRVKEHDYSDECGECQ